MNIAVSVLHSQGSEWKLKKHVSSNDHQNRSTAGSYICVTARNEQNVGGCDTIVRMLLRSSLHCDYAEHEKSLNERTGGTVLVCIREEEVDERTQSRKLAAIRSSSASELSMGNSGCSESDASL